MTEDNNTNIENDNKPYTKEYIINGIPVLITCLNKEQFLHEKRKAVMRTCYYKNVEKRKQATYEYYKNNKEKCNQQRLENYHKNKEKKGIKSREDYLNKDN